MSNTCIIPYLMFSGRCEEAIEFYRKAIGAEVEMLMYHRDSPDPPPPGMLQPGFEDKVMHATLNIAGATLMASDGCNDTSQFSGFSLSLAFPDQQAARKAFDALAERGQVQMPLTATFWSPFFGMVTDQFGVNWMVTVTQAPSA
jgi:PhnB protein